MLSEAMLLDFDQSPVSQNPKYEQKITSDNSDMEIVEIDNDSEPTPRPAKKKRQTSDSEDGDVGPGEAFQTPLTLKRPVKVRKWSLYDSSSSDSGESEDGTDNREGEKNRMMVVKGKDAHKQAKVNISIFLRSCNNHRLCATLGNRG